MKTLLLFIKPSSVSMETRERTTVTSSDVSRPCDWPFSSLVCTCSHSIPLKVMMCLAHTRQEPRTVSRSATFFALLLLPLEDEATEQTEEILRMVLLGLKRVYTHSTPHACVHTGECAPLHMWLECARAQALGQQKYFIVPAAVCVCVLVFYCSVYLYIFWANLYIFRHLYNGINSF